VNRRSFITLLGGAVAWPLAARAQQGERVRRIGVLITLGADDPEAQRRAMALEQGLEKLGWTIGRNLHVDYRWGASDNERARAGAAELLKLAPELILANSPPAVRAVQQTAAPIPIVFVGVSEPVRLGLVSSLARPGGNTTGFTNLKPSLGDKWLELLREIAPGVKRVAFMFDPTLTPITPLFFRSVESAAPKLAVESVLAHVQSVVEIEAAMSKLGREPGGGLIVPPNAFTAANHRQIVALALQNRLPSIFAFQYFAAAGGLISYGPDLVDQFRRAASYVDRILRGEPPGDLPVEQPSKFELVINLKTAKTLGLDVPPTLLARADEVIE
jgi:ABC-type uncharacterized transport system substrate-binding protein